MGYFADGLFTGFLASVKETGRKFKNGAKELVEDFVSGFNGHGWKLWKRGDSWRLELDELLVRKSFQVFELIINQITAIKGSQAITQGHAKIKDVTVVESADVYREVAKEVYALDFSSYNWAKVGIIDSNSLIITHNELKFDAINNTTTVALLTGDIIPAMTVEISNLTGVGGYEYFDNDRNKKNIYFEENGRYELPYSNMPPNVLTSAGFSIEPGGAITVKQIPLRTEITETITQETCYRIQIDDELNSISEYDLVRCQKGDKFYYVQVGSVFQYYINIPLSEFDTNEEGTVMNPPQAGDELVQFGNASHQEKYANRHSAIYLHVDEDEPAIDLMTDIYTKDWSEGNILKTRIGGNLPGTDGERGFYAVNGKLLFVDEEGNTVSVINPDGSGHFAKGKFSWTKDGSPSFSGTILLSTSQDNVWEVTEDCVNIIGNKQGKHIEINANNAEIKIFNSFNKLSTIFEGNSYFTLEDLFESSKTDIVIKNIPASYAYKSNDTMPVIVDISNVFYTSGDVNIIYSYNMQIINEQSSNVKSSVAVYLYTYSDESLTNLVQEQLLIRLVNNISGYEGSASKEDVYNLIPKGYHIIRVLFNAISKSILTLPLFSARLELTGYLSKYYANGLALGDSIGNVASFYNDINLHVNGLITNDKYGLKIDHSRILSKNNGLWGMIPSILCVGRVSGTEAGYSYLVYKTFDGSTMPSSIRRNGTGWVTITFPSDWAKYAIGYDNAYVMLTGIGTSWSPDSHTWSESPMKATFRTWIQNPSGFDVLLSDDATRNDGDFMFEVKLLQ